MAYDRLLLLDDEAKRFTAKAAGTISGGDLVSWNSGTDVVGSDLSTYSWDDIAVVKCDDPDNCIGIALQDASSGAAVPIAHTGIYILPAGSNTVSGGWPVHACGYGNMVESFPMNRETGSGLQYVPIGRALSQATALTGFAIIRLDV